MRAAFRLRRDNREHDGNAAVYNQLFDGCRSCFHNDRRDSGQIRRRGGELRVGRYPDNQGRVLKMLRSQRNEKDL